MIKLLSAPSVVMLLIFIAIVIMLAFLGLVRSPSPTKSNDETDDLGIQFEKIGSEKINDFSSKSTKSELLDPTHITRLARRSNRDGK
jgi:hypothetical protein